MSQHGSDDEGSEFGQSAEPVERIAESFASRGKFPECYTQNTAEGLLEA